MEIITAIINWLLNLSFFSIIFEDEAGVFLRGGRYTRTLDAGFYWKWPLYDNIEKTTITEQTIDLPNQSVETADGVPMAVSGTLRYTIVDAKKALLEVRDYDESLQNIGLKSIAGYIARTNRPDLIFSQLEKEVSDELKLEADDWGLDIIEFNLTDLVKHRIYRLMTDK